MEGHDQIKQPLLTRDYMGAVGLKYACSQSTPSKKAKRMTLSINGVLETPDSAAGEKETRKTGQRCWTTYS